MTQYIIKRKKEWVENILLFLVRKEKIENIMQLSEGKQEER